MLSSTLNMIKVEKKKETNNVEHPESVSNSNFGIDMALFIDLKSQMTILSQQYSRIETDIKDLAQKVEGIGRITINNMNNNVAKTGAKDFMQDYNSTQMAMTFNHTINDAWST